MRYRLVASIAVCAGMLLATPAGAEPHGEDPNQCAHLDGKPVPKKGGFSHVIRVRNTCTEQVTCEVWTSVDSKKRATLDVPASAEAKATVRDGSPISIFRAKGKCSF